MKKFFLTLVSVVMFGTTTMSAQDSYSVVHGSDYVNGTGDDRIEFRNDDTPRTFNVSAYMRNQQATSQQAEATPQHVEATPQQVAATQQHVAAARHYAEPSRYDDSRYYDDSRHHADSRYYYSSRPYGEGRGGAYHRHHAPVRSSRVVVVESAPVVYGPAPMPPVHPVIVAAPRPEAIVGAAIGTVVGAAITSLILR